MNLNKVFLIGRMAADPESRTTPSGQTVTTVRLATNRVWNNRATGEKQEQVEFHTIIAWGNLAEIVSKYLRKGQLAMFEGRLQTRSWQGQDGVKRYRTEIVAENMQLGPKAMGSGNYQSNNQAPVHPVKSAEGGAAGQQFNRVKEEDIPVINEDAPVTSDPIISDSDIEEKEIDLKDIPF
ncbi:MAG: single-stranded DNA-binding protein [Candidatus Yanofskybacteria bacterium]|nr:single-stranded DNA-binding protein [Candidatus Yanofskybacteria bacterium]